MLSGRRWRPIWEVLIRDEANASDCNNSDWCIKRSNLTSDTGRHGNSQEFSSYRARLASKILCSLLHNTYIISVEAINYCKKGWKRGSPGAARPGSSPPICSSFTSGILILVEIQTQAVRINPSLSRSALFGVAITTAPL